MKFGSPSHGNQRRKRNKSRPNWKVSTIITADDMILYIENPKDTTRKLLQLINNSVKLQETKLTHINQLHFIFFFFLFFLTVLPEAYASSQARGGIRAVAARLCHSHR